MSSHMDQLKIFSVWNGLKPKRGAGKNRGSSFNTRRATPRHGKMGCLNLTP